MDQCVVAVQENCAEEPDFLDGVSVVIDLDPVTDIIRVLNEEEDDTGQDFGETSANEPTKTCQASPLQPRSSTLKRNEMTYQE